MADNNSRPADPLEDASDLAFVYVTFPTRQLAVRVGREAVEQRLAACTNIFTEHESIFRWEDKIEKTSECSAIFKTVDGKCDELATFIRSQHPFDVPCIAVMTPDQMNESFAKWLRTAT